MKFWTSVFLVMATATTTAKAEVSRLDPIPRTRAPPFTKRGSVVHYNVGSLDLAQRIRAGSDEPQTPTALRPITTKTAVGLGMLLALNSGIVNGVTLSGLLQPTKQASAAVTGAWTNSALGAASGNSDQFAFNAKCIVSYCFGSLISGFVNPTPEPFVISVPSVRTALFVGSALLFAAGRMVGKDDATRDYIFVAAIANGIQNSLTSTTTANLCRSAHFSGITSDIGTFAGQVLRGNKQNLIKLKVFCALGLSFWTGGYFSYSLAKRFEASTLLFSSFLYLVLGLLVGGV